MALGKNMNNDNDLPNDKNLNDNNNQNNMGNNEEVQTLKTKIEQLEREKLQVAEEIKSQTEEVKAQEEELRQNLEEMQATQEEVQRNAAAMKGVLDAIDTAFAYIEFDPIGNILTANSNFLSTVNYSIEEVKGKHHRMFVDATYSKSTEYSNFWNDLGNGKSKNGKFLRFGKSGNEIWLQAAYSPVYDQAGKVIKVIKIASDITEQVETEAQLQRDIDARTAAVDSACIVSEVDLKGYITYVNDMHCEVSGYTREELVGKNQNMVRHEDMPKETFKQLWSTIQNGKIFNGLVKNKRKDGTPYYVNGIFTPVMGKDGKPVKYLGIRFHITDSTLAALASKGVVDAVDTAFASLEFDTKGNVLSANDKFLSSMEYSSSDVIGKHHRTFIDSELANSSDYKNFWEDCAAGKVKEDLMKCVSRSGNDVWMQSVFSPIKDDMGRIVRIIQIASDISIAKEEADQLQRDIDARTAAVDVACIVSEVDLKGIITYVNDMHCEVSGYSREELLGKNQNMVRHEDMPKETFKQLWSTIQSGKIFTGLVKNKRKDGTPYYVDGIFTPVLGKNGKPVKYLGIRFHITESTQAAQASKGIVDGINGSYAFIEFDTKGNIITANENFLKTTEYSLNEITGKHHRMFIDREHANSAEYGRFWDDLAAGKANVGQFKRITRSGKEVWLQAVYSPVKDDMGRIFKVIKIATDITIQKEAAVATDAAAAEVNRVVNAMANGDLTQTYVIDSKGELKTMGDALNTAIGNINTLFVEVNRVISAMAGGDLTQKYSIQSKGALNEMGMTLNKSIENLGSLLLQISQISTLVASSSEELLTKGEQMKNTTQEVASATVQMAEGAQQQAIQTDESSKLIDGVLKSANEMGKKAEFINSAAERGQKSATEGLSTIRKVVDNMSEIQNSATVTSTSINVLAQRSEEIASTLSVITDIASQTNLLALNAAIEAARAGDAGRGFAVVAEEIRKLAEGSRKSAIDIEKVIREVQKDVTAAGKSIETMEVSVKAGNIASKEAENVFQNIEKTSTETLGLSNEIVAATDIQKEAINATVKNIEKIVVISEETASGTEQVASSGKDLAQGMNEVTSTSRDLADAANQLQDSVSKFKLK